MIGNIDVHRFVRERPLGSEIKVEIDSEIKTVSLVGRGRKRLRVKNEEGETFLVDLTQVVVEPSKS